MKAYKYHTKKKKDTKLLKLFFKTPVSLKTDIYTLMLATFSVSHLSVCIAEYSSLHFKTKLKHQDSVMLKVSLQKASFEARLVVFRTEASYLNVYTP